MPADGRLRLVRLGPNHAVEASRASADIGVTSKEVHRARAKTKQLRHDGIVVLLGGEMAVGAIFCRAHAAGRVGEMGIESLSAITFGGDGLLLRVDPFAIGIL